jgi:hypothetical protein
MTHLEDVSYVQRAAPIPGRSFLISSDKPQATSCKPQVASFKPEDASRKLQVTNSEVSSGKLHSL